MLTCIRHKEISQSPHYSLLHKQGARIAYQLHKVRQVLESCQRREAQNGAEATQDCWAEKQARVGFVGEGLAMEALRFAAETLPSDLFVELQEMLR
jgi:hypothetical protein